MQIAIVGLGRMGGNIARRLMRAGHECLVYDIDAKARAALGKEGGKPAETLEALVKGFTAKRRAVWVMLPAGRITETTITTLAGLLDKNDIVIDGGNSFYKDDIRRARTLAEQGIAYVDCGTSGGVWGLERGYCMMIGGEDAAVKHIDPILQALAPGIGDIPRTKRPSTESAWQAEMGYVHCGPAGSGHFVKMVHNGIEYGMMQAYAEGFDILKQRAKDDLPEDMRFELNLSDISEVWRRGSVISSWLLDLIAIALANDQSLSKYSGRVADSGEGRWTIDAAIEEAVPVDVLAAALFARFRSRVEFSYADQLLSAMRHGFGGHVEMPQ